MLFAIVLVSLSLLSAVVTGTPAIAPPSSANFVGSRPVTRLNANANTHADAVAKRAEWSGWGGAAVYASPDNPITSVSGMLHVPSCWGSKNMGAGPVFSVATWVGIDGTSGDAAGLLQAGVVCSYDLSSGAGSQQAFVEYWPAAMQTISFPAVEGQDITINLTVLSATSGAVAMRNYETGATFTTTLAAPVPSATLPGASAEWITERYQIGGGPASFAGFETVLWADSAAQRRAGPPLPADNANAWTLTDDSGAEVSRLSLDGDGKPRLDFTGQFAVAD